MDDPDAPAGTWDHWLFWDIPCSVHSIPQQHRAARPVHSGTNDFGRTGYGGPCPPAGRHRYFFKLYTLDTTLPDLHRPNKAKLEKAMKGHILAHAELVGTYQRHH